VLKRLRIHEATDMLAVAMPPAWTKLALDLGYYDHAHFIRDFRLVVGRSPVQYARRPRRLARWPLPARRSRSTGSRKPNPPPEHPAGAYACA
jgi:AraC-like DNA-binding protein